MNLKKLMIVFALVVFFIALFAMKQPGVRSIEVSKPTQATLGKTQSHPNRPGSFGISLNKERYPGEQDSAANQVRRMCFEKRVLNAKEIEELMDLIRTRGPICGLQPLHSDVLKNEILNLLRNQPARPSNLTRCLIETTSDRTQYIVTRDYCLQHLSSSFSSVPQRDKDEIRAVFWSAIAEKGTSMPGTALIALFRNLDPKSLAERQKLQSTASEIVADPSYGNLARITAFQICGETKVSKVAAVARQLSRDSRNLPLRVSAIAYLGQVGGPKDRSLLKSILLGPDATVKPAARTALTKLENKSNSSKDS